MSEPLGKSDRRLLMILCGATLVLIVLVSVFAPAQENDPKPTTFNAGPQGAKAAYLLLQALGRSASRWEKPLEDLDDAQAAQTTLLLAEPVYAATDQKELAAEVKRFLEHGGRVLATGDTGAMLLPGGEAKAASMFQEGLCYTTPEGPGELARAGEVEIAEQEQWAAEGAQYRVEQRCNGDAVVVRFAVRGADGAAGEAVWWSSASPLTNAGLKNDANLRLLLASVGDGRAVLFDESLHGTAPSMWSTAKGLPLWWLAAQTALLMVLLVLSFSRRRGPIRMPVMRPRTSPLEFAESMGDLYEKAGATEAATEAARRRLLRVLIREAGVSQASIEFGPAAIAEALTIRLGGDWSRLAEHLENAAVSRETKVSARTALALVRAMSEDAEEVRAAIAPRNRARDAVQSEHTLARP